MSSTWLVAVKALLFSRARAAPLSLIPLRLREWTDGLRCPDLIGGGGLVRTREIGACGLGKGEQAETARIDDLLCTCMGLPSDAYARRVTERGWEEVERGAGVEGTTVLFSLRVGTALSAERHQ